MAKAIETLSSGLRIGHASLGARGDVQGSVRQQTYDGDTVIVDPDGNLGLRLLGVDAPEVSFPLPGSSTAFTSTAIRAGRSSSRPRSTTPMARSTRRSTRSCKRRSRLAPGRARP